MKKGYLVLQDGQVFEGFRFGGPADAVGELVFTTGMVRELLSDMAWTITFSLLASLVVALTVVPCAGSTVLKKQKDIKHPLFDKVLNGYEKLLRFCLRRKAVPLALAIALLGVSVWRVATMGIVMIPDMSSNQLTITVNVRFVNNTNHAEDFEQQFSAFRVYDSSQLLTAVQDGLIAEMSKEITDQIFNATVANW